MRRALLAAWLPILARAQPDATSPPSPLTCMSEYVELLFTNKIKLPQQFGGPATSITRTLVEDAELSRFISTSHVDKRALAAINNAVYQVLLDKIVVGERPREEIMRLVDGLPGLATATTLLVALYSKVSGADPDLQERAYEELARTPLLASGFGRESEQVLAEFKQLWHAVMWLNERRNHKAKTHHELHASCSSFVSALEAPIRERVRRESEAPRSRGTAARQPHPHPQRCRRTSQKPRAKLTPSPCSCGSRACCHGTEGVSHRPPSPRLGRHGEKRTPHAMPLA